MQQRRGSKMRPATEAPEREGARCALSSPRYQPSTASPGPAENEGACSPHAASGTPQRQDTGPAPLWTPQHTVRPLGASADREVE